MIDDELKEGMSVTFHAIETEEVLEEPLLVAETPDIGTIFDPPMPVLRYRSGSKKVPATIEMIIRENDSYVRDIIVRREDIETMQRYICIRVGNDFFSCREGLIELKQFTMENQQ